LNIPTAAVIGCGRIGTFTRPELRQGLPRGTVPVNHAEAIQACNNLRLVALCDINRDSLGRASLDYGVANGYTDFRSLIQEIRPAIVSIATRTAGRCEILKFAAEHGVKGIYIEKPISNSVAECREAIAVAVSKGAHLSYGTYRRFMDIYRYAKDLLRQGEIGELLQISVELGQTLLMWNHPHSIDMMLYFSDCCEVEYVQGACRFGAAYDESRQLLDDDPVVEQAIIKFKNGVSGVVVSRGGGNVTLCGTKGNLVIAADGSWIDLQKKNQNTPYFTQISRLEVEPLMSGVQRAFSELAMAVREGTPLSITPLEIETSQKILLGIAYSAIQYGQRLTLERIPDSFFVTGRFGDLLA